jgi:hypothetical protein
MLAARSNELQSEACSSDAAHTFFRSPLGKPTLCELVPATSQIGCEVAHGLYVVYLRSTDLGEP